MVHFSEGFCMHYNIPRILSFANMLCCDFFKKGVTSNGLMLKVNCEGAR